MINDVLTDKVHELETRLIEKTSQFYIRLARTSLVAINFRYFESMIQFQYFFLGLQKKKLMEVCVDVNYVEK